MDGDQRVTRLAGRDGNDQVCRFDEPRFQLVRWPLSVEAHRRDAPHAKRIAVSADVSRGSNNICPGACQPLANRSP